MEKTQERLAAPGRRSGHRGNATSAWSWNPEGALACLRRAL